MTGRIHLIETFGTVDGPGIRYVLFLQGCPLKCLYCHNPDTWKISGGWEMSVDEVLADVKNYFGFIKNGGFTLSGGEPLLQIDFAAALVQGAKKMGLHTAVDTSGAIPLAKCRHVIDETDLILLDVKTADPQFYKPLTGGQFSHVIELLDYCEAVKKPVWVRHVVVPGLTLDDTKLQQIAVLLKNYSCIEKIELLPFHKMGEEKWSDAGLEYELAETPPPTAAQMEHAANIFYNNGIDVHVKKL
jgi:pyruvate formate lyase activating enzyme